MDTLFPIVPVGQTEEEACCFQQGGLAVGQGFEPPMGQTGPLKDTCHQSSGVQPGQEGAAQAYEQPGLTGTSPQVFSF